MKNDRDWPYWYICGPDNVNCWEFPDRPGAVFSTREFAELVAKELNACGGCIPEVLI